MAVKNEQIEKNLVKLTFEVERLSKSIIQRLYSMMKLLTAYFRRLMTKL